MAVSLRQDTLEQVSEHADVPPYAFHRDQIIPSKLHIGPSAFFRAHLAVMDDDLLQRKHEKGVELDCGIVCVSLRTPKARDLLGPQDNLYTVTTMGSSGQSRPRVIGSIADVIVAQENPDLVIQAAASPNIKLITMTVTQDGYSPDDVDEMSTVKLIVDSLDLRRKHGIAPPTIMSLDNMTNNGDNLKAAVMTMARNRSPELAEWIQSYVAFPNTMVDRITPKSTDALTSSVRDKGVDDRWPIQAEPMPALPLVYEGKVSIDPANKRPVQMPDLEAAGAVKTDNVLPYELLKLRTLNGVHMALGCIGHMSGYKYAHEAMAEPCVRNFAIGFMNETGRTLLPTPGVCHDHFRADVVSRLDNPALMDELTRLARNGVSKVSSRFLEPLKDIISNEGTNSPDNFRHLAFAAAAWVTYASNLDETGRVKGGTNGPNDEKAKELGITNTGVPVANPFRIEAYRQIFGAQLAAVPALEASITRYLNDINTLGMHGAVKKFIDDAPGKSIELRTDSSNCPPGRERSNDAPVAIIK